MSNQNEIDDILNELKNKKGNYDLPDKDNKKADDFFYSFKPSKNETDTEDEENIILNMDFGDNKSSAEKSPSEAEHNNFEIVSDFADGKQQNGINLNEIYTSAPDDNGSGGKKKIAIIAVIAVLVIAIIAGVVFALTKDKNKEEETTTTTAPVTTTEAAVKIINPFTGESNYNENAVGKRPVACVVENAYDARPQWGIDDSKSSPDIILEGEVEGGETRMLWFYADYTSLPAQIGPVRSARPPYIRFAMLFDSIFIHWGQSASRDNYVGADSVFKTENVDHINQMAYSDSIGLFGRDSSRGVSSEHTGVLYGDKLEQAIKEAEFRTDVNESAFSKLSFNDSVKAVGTQGCTSFSLAFSSNTKTRDWTYNAEDKMYHCSDYLTDVARTNLLVLYDQTEYIAKNNYKGTGKAEIYCDYKLSGGSGKLVSYGTITDITWSVDSGILEIKDSNGKKVNLNPGKTWIGYASSNHGGSDVNNTEATAQN